MCGIPSCFDQIDKAEKIAAMDQGANCKRIARSVVISAGYLKEEYTDRNLLNVKINKFPELVNKVN
jgi:hypothetical protein